MPEWNFYSKVAGSYLPLYGFNHKVRKNRVKLKLVFISEHAVPLNSEWKLILHYLQHRKKEKNMCNRNLCQITEGRFYLRRAVPLLPLLLLLLLPLLLLLLYSMIMSLFGERSGFFPTAWLKTPSNNLLQRRWMQQKRNEAICIEGWFDRFHFGAFCELTIRLG